MRIKKFTARTMREALLQVKQDLGEDAIILKTRKLPKKLLSLAGQDEVEVTAAIDDSPATRRMAPLQVSRPKQRGPSKPPSEMPTYGPRPRSSPAAAIATDSPLVSAPPPRQQTDQASEKLHYLELKEDVRELRDLLTSVLRSGRSEAAGGFSDGWAVLYKRLVDSEVKPDVAAGLVKGIQEKKGSLDATNEKELVSILSEHFPVAGPLRPAEDRAYVVAFVGPTGSGKTTTLAKLAAHLSLNRGKLVSIVTGDTYRIAAIEQIRTFADIVNVGLQVVFSPNEIDEVLTNCENDDVVFVDTAGRSQKNSEHMEDLRKLLDALQPDEVHLVLSAATKDSDLKDIIQRYKGFGVNRLLFTKLDETVRLGNIFNAVTSSGIPVSYFTTGQAIPDDIELAQSARFVQRLWQGAVP